MGGVFAPSGLGSLPGLEIRARNRDRATVQSFHRVGLAHGGSDDGAPGLHAEYDQNYYGAFLRDPDGNTRSVSKCRRTPPRDSGGNTWPAEAERRSIAQITAARRNRS